MSQKSIFSFNNIESPFGDWMQEIEAQREVERKQRLEMDRLKDKYDLEMTNNSSRKFEIAYFTTDGEYLGMVEGNMPIKS